MPLKIIYDASQAAPPNITALLGVSSFRNLVFRRRNLLQWLQEACRLAEVEAALEVSSTLEWQALAMELDRRPPDPNARFLVCPSQFVALSPPEELSNFLRHTVHAPSLFRVPPRNRDGVGGWVLLDEEFFKGYVAAAVNGTLRQWTGRANSRLMKVTERIQLADLTDEVALLEFLGRGYDARFFNQLEPERFVVTKKSSDREKIAREFTYLQLLPAEMRMFFLSPYAFEDDGTAASYKMERLFVPDVAIQWIHAGFREDEFARFLELVFRFIHIRQRRPADAAHAGALADNLFVTKVERRIDELERLPEYPRVAPYLELAFGGIRQLLQRYLKLIERRRRDLAANALVIGHGDLCFSNMLYGKSVQMLKLIDPRGARTEDELFTHPLYDLAKLSHSVLGNYDFINHDMFDVRPDEALRPVLRLDRSSPTWAREAFARQLDEAGFELSLVRLCEASLFISMLPLHIDRPRKVLGFALNAAEIITALEQGTVRA